MISADLEKVKQSWVCFVPERMKLKIFSEKSNGKVVLYCCQENHLDVELASNKSLLSLVGIVKKQDYIRLLSAF